ncbi:MAG: ferrous iron transport protein B [Hyphomicrobiales bacterium]
MTLRELKQGETAYISKVKGRGAFRKRIIEMGFIVGKEVTVIKKAPLKDPIEYKIMGYNVSLRAAEAGLIEISNQTCKNNSHYNGVIEVPVSNHELKYNQKVINIALVGNPNCGKTTIFNYASNSKERVGNYSGVTVSAKNARFEYNGYSINIIDLPGTYSITSYTPEELYVRDHIFNEIPDIVLNVIDSTNLERNLYLTTQLIDMDIKMVVALNMFDELEQNGNAFKYDVLGKMLGIPMMPTVGSKGQGLHELFDKIIEVYEDKEPHIRHIHINYGQSIEESIKKIQDCIKKPDNINITSIVCPRFIAIKALEGDKEEIKRIKDCANHAEIYQTIDEETKKLETLFNDNIETIITDAKYGFINGALKETYTSSKKETHTKSKKIDNLLTHPFLSYPIFLFFMFLTFEATFILGAKPQEWIESFTAWVGQLISLNIPDGIVKDALIDGVIGGVGGVLVFLPNILILFFFLSLMEDSGYMARVAFIVDKFMHKIGLHGRSFIPLLMGFGCNVPAIMATRTIESPRDRLITMLITPFMSCSARYTVYILLISAFFHSYQGLILFGIYVAGIIIAGIIALVFKKTLSKKEDIPFVMELPPYRMPTTKAILKHTWFKGSQYLKKIGGTILLASLIIWALGYFPRSNDYTKDIDHKIEIITSNYQKTNNNTISVDSKTIDQSKEKYEKEISNLEIKKEFIRQEHSYIGQLGKAIEPVISPLGFDWKMGVSLIAGGAAKEIVVSTLGVLYQVNTNDNSNDQLIERIKQQKYETGKDAGKKVFTPLVAISFITFILIYFPCIAVIATIKKEAGKWKYALFLATYTTILAWIASFIVYQLGTLLGF